MESWVPSSSLLWNRTDASFQELFPGRGGHTAPYYTWDFTIAFTLDRVLGSFSFFLFGTTNKEVRGWVWEGNYLSGDTVIELHHPWKERLEEGWMGVRQLKPLSLF